MPAAVESRPKGFARSSPSTAFDQYLHDIQKLPLITDVEEERRLARRAQGGDERAAERLVTANLRFVISYVKKYQGPGLDLSELVAIGNEGLLKAVRKFDPDQGVKFISYAVWWVRQAVLKALAEQTRVVRVAVIRKLQGVVQAAVTKAQHLSGDSAARRRAHDTEPYPLWTIGGRRQMRRVAAHEVFEAATGELRIRAPMAESVPPDAAHRLPGFMKPSAINRARDAGGAALVAGSCRGRGARVVAAAGQRLVVDGAFSSGRGVARRAAVRRLVARRSAPTTGGIRAPTGGVTRHPVSGPGFACSRACDVDPATATGGEPANRNQPGSPQASPLIHD